jgi:threonine synthase
VSPHEKGEATLRCSECRSSFSADEPIWVCPSCGGILEVQQDLSKLTVEKGSDSLEGPGRGVWRYADLIPVNADTAVSMGEGDTPVVPLTRLGQELGLAELYAKLEYFSPTGSFKDRGATVLVSKARQLGVRCLVEDSSGNAGASFAAYCARAGIAASIYVPASAPEAKRAQIAFYGGEAVVVEGTRDDVAAAAAERCREDGAYYGTHNLNPWFLEGTKTFAFEVAESFQLDPPEHVVMPTGNGSLVLGSWKGFGELRTLGVIDRAPRLHVVQAEACMPIVHAFQHGLERTESIPTRPTVAGGISIARPSRGCMILRVLRGSGGSGVSVTDDEILRWQRKLASLEGIFCEPTSAAAIAALPKLLQLGTIKPRERVLVAITGMGLKDTSVLGR